jgi:two-component system LytT family response regulator
MTLRVLLVDDEPPARRRLRTLLAEEPDVAVVGECSTAEQAITAIRQTGPDLVFLDVRMPEGDGFTVADAVGGDGPLIVFVTAFGEHAVRAFDVRAFDYLTKPIAPERLAASIDRARLTRVSRAVPLRRLPIEAGRRLLLVNTDEIEYLSAEDDYVRVHLSTTSHLLRTTLTALCARLDARDFIRVHRSFAVRIDRVREVETLPHGELLLRLTGGATVISGRTYAAGLRRALGL